MQPITKSERILARLIENHNEQAQLIEDFKATIPSQQPSAGGETASVKITLSTGRVIKVGG